MHFSGFSTSVSLPVVGVWCACTVRLSEDTSKMLGEDVTFVCHCFPPLCWGKLFHFICITAEMKNSSETACRLNTAQRHILGPKNLPHHTKSGLGSFCFLIFSDLTSCFSSKTNCDCKKIVSEEQTERGCFNPLAVNPACFASSIKSAHSVEGKTKQTVGNLFYSGFYFHLKYSCHNKSEVSVSAVVSDESSAGRHKQTDWSSKYSRLYHHRLVQIHRVFKVLLHHKVESSLFTSNLWTFTTLTNCQRRETLIISVGFVRIFKCRAIVQ